MPQGQLPRKIRLAVLQSDAGKEFVLYAKRVLSELERARNAMLDHSNLHKGSIKIEAIPIITYRE